MHTEQKKVNCEKTQGSRTHGTIISSEFSSLDAEKVKRKKYRKIASRNMCFYILWALQLR